MDRLILFVIALLIGAFAGYWATTNNMLPPGVPGMTTASPPPTNPTEACPPAGPTESPPPSEAPTESPPPTDPT